MGEQSLKVIPNLSRDTVQLPHVVNFARALTNRDAIPII